MYDSKWSNRYDRFGYVQRGYDNGQLYEQAVDMYREWERTNELKNPCSEIRMEFDKPKPDRRILLALG